MERRDYLTEALFALPGEIKNLFSRIELMMKKVAELIYYLYIVFTIPVIINYVAVDDFVLEVLILVGWLLMFALITYIDDNTSLAAKMPDGYNISLDMLSATTKYIISVIIMPFFIPLYGVVLLLLWITNVITGIGTFLATYALFNH